MRQAIKELAEKRRKWVEANRENGFEAGLKRLLTDLYPDNAHFVYELLQNAEDAHAQEVRFILHEDRIEFEHNGKRLFEFKDVNAITGIGFSAKRDDVTNIGKFGVGFKAVFAYTDSPEIESGDLHFRIRDMVVPDLEGVSESFSRDGQTRFILPFNNPKKSPQRARSEIERLLKSLGATTLLFLTHIHKIEYLLPDSSLGYIERINFGESRFEIRLQQPSELAPSATWFMKFDKEAQVEDEEAENESQKVKSCRIAVALGLTPVEAKAGAKEKKSGGTAAIPEWELVPMEPGRVCIYFPADKETSNLRFHLHAPFASTVARDSVRDCAGNNVLRDHLADLLAESMSAIRDQGLLTVRTLALLPNDKDNLPEFYQPIMDRLIDEFKERDLVPMKRGDHAAASGIFRSTRALSDLIGDDDMVMLLGDGYVTPIWASNPPQRNQREDNFLSMLSIEQWDAAEFVRALGRLNRDALRQWMGSKDDKWHHILYEMLMDYLNAAPRIPYSAAAERKGRIKGLDLARCSDGTHRKGGECYFPTDGVEHDDKFPRVAKSAYFAGNEKNEKAYKFLEAIGVREVDEQVEIEYILKSNYLFKSEHPNLKDHYRHLLRFIKFLKENAGRKSLFSEVSLFMIGEGNGAEWKRPKEIYLDTPFMETGLRSYYDILGAEGEHFPLSRVYEKLGINPNALGKFAEKLGAGTSLPVKSVKVPHSHPEWYHLNSHGGDRWTSGSTNADYLIPKLKQFLASPSIVKSRLVWNTMIRSCHNGLSQYLKAFFGRNAKHRSIVKSTLVHDLLEAKWVPQNKLGEGVDFVSPRDATAEQLPPGFVYQTGWDWLHELEFGQDAEKCKLALQREKEKQTEQYKKKEATAQELGFNSSEEAEKVARLMNENPEEFKKLEERISARKERPTFPSKSVANPERREEYLGEQLSGAPEKEYEKRERSVRTTNGAIDPTTWIRNQYTNEADQMVCQICKEEMPFRKRDGKHYFEKKEVLSRRYMPKEHEAQYLALCPLCAAKYDEFVKTDDAVMAEIREEIVSAEDCEIPISLGDVKTSIRFVETHLHDLKFIILRQAGR